MRSESQMYKLILDIANQDERIYAVYMNGSRTNKNVPEDMFQDFDIVYVVEETGSFRKDKKWIEKFGRYFICSIRKNRPIIRAIRRTATDG